MESTHLCAVIFLAFCRGRVTRGVKAPHRIHSIKPIGAGVVIPHIGDFLKLCCGNLSGAEPQAHPWIPLTWLSLITFPEFSTRSILFIRAFHAPSDCQLKMVVSVTTAEASFQSEPSVFWQTRPTELKISAKPTWCVHTEHMMHICTQLDVILLKGWTGVYPSVCRIYRSLPTEMEHNIHNYVFINREPPWEKNQCVFITSEPFISTEGRGPLHGSNK